MKKHIPNLLTCGNLACGCLGIDYAYNGHLPAATYFILLAAVFDFFDGFAARWLGVSSPIGKELDSLADLVSFGLLPGIILLQLIGGYPTTEWRWLRYMALLVPIFSALRLAKFNVDTRQSESFIGVPTPANALLISALPMMMNARPHLYESLGHPLALVAIGILMSLLLVSELPLFALKFKDFKWENNKVRFSFLGASAILILGWQFMGVALSIVCYILLSVALWLFPQPKAGH